MLKITVRYSSPAEYAKAAPQAIEKALAILRAAAINNQVEMREEIPPAIARA